MSDSSFERKPSNNSVDWAEFEGCLATDRAVEAHKIADDDLRWIMLEPSGGVKKIILRHGDEDVTPVMGDTISVKYSLFDRKTGETFETSRSPDNLDKSQQAKIEFGKDKIIKGLEVALLNMKIGERAIIRCSSEFAYGAEGMEDSIAPNTDIDCVLEIDDIPTFEVIGDGDCIWKKTIKEEGIDSWNNAKEWSTLNISYVGREVDINGRKWCKGKNEEVRIPFDLEFEGKGCIKEHDQPRGFYVCLQNINWGETAQCKLKCNDHFTFGYAGSEKWKIPPQTDLWYKIRVNKIDLFEMGRFELKKTEIFPRAQELKSLANDFFKKKKLLVANYLWMHVVEILKEVKDPKVAEFKKEVEVSCLANGALVDIHLLNFEDCEDKIKKGLALDAKHEKLRYRWAHLCYKRGNHVMAEELLATIIEDYPKNKSARTLLAKNSRALKISNKEKKILAQKMFGPEKKYDQEDEEIRNLKYDEN